MAAMTNNVFFPLSDVSDGVVFLESKSAFAILQYFADKLDHFRCH
jgi:hypothetical protein